MERNLGGRNSFEIFRGQLSDSCSYAVKLILGIAMVKLKIVLVTDIFELAMLRYKLAEL